MDESLTKVWARALVDTFKTLRGDIFTLGELEQIFPAIDDGEAALPIDHADVTGTEPAVLSHGLGGFLGVLIIFSEHARSSQEKLTTWVWLIFDGIFHVGQGHETGLSTGRNHTTVACSEITGGLAERHGIALGETIALDDGCGEGCAEELMESLVEGSRSGDHGLHAVETKGRGDLLAPDAVINEVLVGCLFRLRVNQVGHLGGNNVSGQSALESRGLDRRSLDSGTETAVQTGHGRENGGSDELEVIN